jgi:hypothetical protein
MIRKEMDKLGLDIKYQRDYDESKLRDLMEKES